MNQKNNSDSCDTKTIVDLIKANTDATHLKAWNCLHKTCLKKMVGTLRKKGMTQKEDIEEITQNTDVAVFQNILQNKFRREANICTYYIGIALNQWKKRLTKLKKTQALISIKKLETLSQLEEIEAYLGNKLDKKARQQFLESLQNNLDLQEMVDLIALGRPQQKDILLPYDDSIDTPIEEKAKETVSLKAILKKSFEDGLPCLKTLTDYYLVYNADYENMAYAEKRKQDKIKPVYERVKKRVNRCLEKVRKSLNQK